MKILKHFKKVSILLVMFLFMASSSFAATWYVNNTNGDDLNFDGTTTATPFRTIGAAMTAATDGDVISVAADFYAENVTVTKDLTFVVTTNVSNVLTKATVTGNLVINNNGSGAAPGISGAVSIGATGLEFEFTGDFTLTDGTVATASANLRFTNNPLLVTVDNGTIDNTPTYVSNIVNITYIGVVNGSNRSTGAELPGDLNGGSLTNNIAATKTLTVTKDVTIDDLDNTAGRDVIFNGTLFVEGLVGGTTLDNTGGGDITFKGLATFDGDMNNGAGNLVFEAGFVVDAANIINDTGGLVDAQANSSITDGNISNNNAASVIKLNSNTLVFANQNIGAGVGINNVGNIISSTVSTVGSGILQFVGDNTINIIGGGELPNVSIPSTLVVGGTVILGADIDVFGDLTLDAGIANALVDGGNAINMYGDFLRTNDVAPTSYAATGLLAFLGTVNQTFDPGASLQITDLTINNNNKTVTMLASIEVLGSVDIKAAGNLELDTYNIRMLTALEVFNNDGTYLSTAKTGFVIFESGGANTLSGAGDFSNIDIRSTSVVTYTTDINFSGILNLRDASLNSAGASIFNLDDVFVTIPSVNVWTDLATFVVGGAANVDISAGVLYDLTYLGATAGPYAAGGEWSTNIATSLNDLSINTARTAALNVVTGPASPSTIAGILDVDGLEGVNLNAQNVTLIGGGVNHTVDGTVSNGTLIAQGDASSITGSVVAANGSTVNNLTVDLASTAETFTSTGLRNITGNLTHNDGTSNIMLSNDDVVAPGTTGPTFVGNLVVTAGDLTFGMTTVASTVGGTSTLTDGSLTLGSNLTITGVTQQDDGDLFLNSFDYRATAVYTHGPAVTTPGVVSGTGFLVLNYVGNFILNDPLSVSNLEIDGTIVQTVDDLTVTSEWLATSGSYNQVALDITLTGNTFTQDGAVVYAATTGIFFFNGTAMTADLSADADIPNVTLNATSIEIVDNDGDANPGEFQFVISNDFVQTAGDINHNDNDVVIQNDWTRTAGNVTSIDDGFWIFDAAGVLDQGVGFSVDRVSVINGAAAMADDDAWTLVEYLQLDAAFTPGLLNRGAANEALQLTFGADAWIERMQNAAGMTDEALYSGDINLLYSTVGPITTSDEASAATINDVIARVQVTLERDLLVNGTLTVDRRNGTGLGAINATANDGGGVDNTVDMADKSLIYFMDASGANLDENLNPAGTLNVYYDNNTGGPVVATDRELNPTFTLGDVTVDGNDPGEDVQMHASNTVNGTLLINDDGDFDLVDFTLTLDGAYTQTSTGQIINTTGIATGAVLFGGTTNNDITLNGNWVIPVIVPAYTVGINTTTADVVKTLKGGDIDFETNGADLKLMQGVFGTDATSSFVLRHTDDGAQPVQGFTRSGDSHISGNVKKYLDATGTRYGRTQPQVATGLTRVEFPVGSEPASPSHYRPFALAFSSLPTANTWITVNHTNSKPAAGTNGSYNGLPLNTGEGFTVTNFSNFYWTMTSDLTLQPSVIYHVEAGAEGYQDQYADSEVQFIRFLRQLGNNADNPWVLQGASGYDNSTDGTTAVVIAKDAEGAVSSQSAIFAYSQRNQAPYFTAELANPTNVTENDLVTQTYAIADNDVTGQTLTMFAVTLPDSATFNATTGEFSWQTGYLDAGTHPVKIGATDGIDTSYAEANIIVADNNRAPTWSVEPNGGSGAADITQGTDNELQWTAVDEDTDNTITYAITVDDLGTATIDAATGLVTINPLFAVVGTTYNLTVTANDGAGAGNSVITSVYVLTVTKLNRAPSFTAELPDTIIDENQALAFTYTATDQDVGDVLTFSLGAAAPAGATIDGATGAFAWTPTYTQAGDHTFKVWVTDDGTPNMSDSSSVTITVNDLNSPPVWIGELDADTVFVGDTFSYTYEAQDLDNDDLTYSFILPKPGAMSQTKVTNETVLVEWSPVIADTATYLIRQIVTDGMASDTTLTLLTVLVTTVDIDGVVAYNISNELLDAVTVTLSNGTDTWTDVTGADGAYLFTGVATGEYTITAEKTTEWGGALASDALETQLYVVNPDSTFLATALQKVAADVVGVGNITSSDALAILNRSVGIDDFQIDDWQFETVSVSAGTQDITQDLMGIAAGDARNDYSPALGLAKVSNITVSSDEVLNIKKESEFELPISIAELAEIGSFTFKLKYDVEKVEFLGVSTENSGTLVANVVDDVISIAWVNLGSKEINVKDGDALATLKFKATDKFGKADEVSLELLDGAEITDRMAKNFNAGLKIPVVAIGIPDVFALRQNYPNPFNPSTTIQYDLPENGKVTLTVYNSLGQRVGTLVNTKQVAGAYEVNFNASNLASGVYLYRVTVEGSKNFVMTKKMILMK